MKNPTEMIGSRYGISHNGVTARNLDYLTLCVHRQANWSQLDDKIPVNQDAVLIPIIFQGQLTCSNRARQGLLLDATS
jgi:hypothetical protein